MPNKKYGLGVIVGRFQILHRGHSQIISSALELCDEVGILVGSSQESGTFKNPFSYEMRRDFLLTSFPELKVFPLPDMGFGNCLAWGNYVLEQANALFGKAPEVFVSGQEDRRESWFGEGVKEIFIPKTIDISASKMKEFIIADDRAAWNEYIEPAIAERYDEMRKIILSTVNNTKTMSI